MDYFKATRAIFFPCILLAICNFILLDALPVSSKPRVAIVGGGIGGSSAAYFVRKLFGQETTIDLYEKSKIGGRLAVVKVGDRFYEAGGSIIHERNQYMRNFLEILKLDRNNQTAGRLGLYDGKKFVFEESHFSAVTYIDLLWRYGFSMFKWNKLMDDMLDSFEKIYSVQDNGYAYTTVENLLCAMSPEFFNLTQISAKDMLLQRDFGEEFINELGLAAARVNYGQTLDINGFVGALSLAAAQPKLWSVYGGNFQLAEGVLKESQANFIHSKVDEISLLSSGKYVISASLLSDAQTGAKSDKEYEIVIVAAPQTKDKQSLKFTGFSKETKFPGSYHRTVATFVEGILNSAHFGFKKPSDNLDEIITINLNVNYNSVARNYPIDSNVESHSSNSKVYKIFSQKPLSDEDLDELFLERKDTQIVDWLAYPQYNPPEQLVDFKIHNFLYYTSAIEWVGSAMEMSAVAAKNVALLAFNEYHDHFDNINSKYHEVTRKKSEL